MSLSKYFEEDLDNDLEAIFADMMDEGFQFKKTPHDPRFGSFEVFNIVVVKRDSSGLSFDIKQYKDHFKQLFDILKRRGIQLYNALAYIDNKSTMINDVDSIMKSEITTGTDFRGKTFDEIWDGLTFTIYSKSEEDSITNLTMTFCEK